MRASARRDGEGGVHVTVSVPNSEKRIGMGRSAPLTLSMSARFVHGLKLRQLTTSAFAPRPRTPPSSSRAIATSLTFDEFTHAHAPAPELSPTELLVAAKTRDLIGSLERGDSNPSRPWGYYVDLLNYMGLEKLPLELHQLVLRKCVPPTSSRARSQCKRKSHKVLPACSTRLRESPSDCHEKHSQRWVACRIG
jgi:hypothetical protein